VTEEPHAEQEPAGPAHRAEVPADAIPPSRARHRRRVTTDAPAGSDPHPDPEPARHVATENDDRLKQDKPPHWG
jgi:hypothetical protein